MPSVSRWSRSSVHPCSSSIFFIWRILDGDLRERFFENKSVPPCVRFVTSSLVISYSPPKKVCVEYTACNVVCLTQWWQESDKKWLLFPLIQIFSSLKIQGNDDTLIFTSQEPRESQSPLAKYFELSKSRRREECFLLSPAHKYLVFIIPSFGIVLRLITPTWQAEREQSYS